MIGWRSLFLYAPLIGHRAPALVIGFGFVIPASPIEGTNTYTIGLLSTVLGFIPAYAQAFTVLGTDQTVTRAGQRLRDYRAAGDTSGD